MKSKTITAKRWEEEKKGRWLYGIQKTVGGIQVGTVRKIM